MRLYRKAGKGTYKGSQPEIARAYLNVYIQRGKIKREPCMFCGLLKVQAHHRDYAKPLQVDWVCQVHHSLITGGKLSLLTPSFLQQ